ncbi:Cell cycle checkpoint protein rad17 [Borealophlyctis nickersoniae]|nr:Cell cycle checkpoint protein rad17 [Borealophlyctis nickersoniae]
MHAQADLAPNAHKFMEAQDEIAVNKKKLLLLTGPSGAGKTAVIQMLSMELNYQILEWCNPVNTNSMQAMYDEEGLLDPEGRPFQRNYTSITRQFADFLASASKAPSLTFASEGHAPLESAPSAPINEPKVILVEDLPNVAHMGTRDAIHTAIRNYLRSTRTMFPLVFIVSDELIDDERGQDSRVRGRIETMAKAILPTDVKESAACRQINFNPVAQTFLVKALTRVADIEFQPSSGVVCRPNKGHIEAIARASGGDIRCALNALQFFSLRGPDSPNDSAWETVPVKGKGKKKAAVKKGAVSVNLDYVGGREANLGDFHALGKILFNKREEISTEIDVHSPPESAASLPDHLAAYERKPLKSNPEDVVESSSMDVEKFVLHLHQNYPTFFFEPSELEMAADYLSLADLTLGTWQHQPQMYPYTASLATRGLMFSHLYPVPSQKLTLHRPQWWWTMKQAREGAMGLREACSSWVREAADPVASSSEAFQLTGLQMDALKLDVLPYLGIITRLQSKAAPHHARLVSNLTTYSQRDQTSYRSAGLQAFGERDLDVAGDDEEEDLAFSKNEVASVVPPPRVVPSEVEDDIEDW